MSYGCTKCSGTAHDVQMRKVLISVGPNQEFQAATIVPTRICLNEKCKQVTVFSNIQIGELVNLVPAPSKQLELPVSNTIDEATMNTLRQQILNELANKASDQPEKTPPESEEN